MEIRNQVTSILNAFYGYAYLNFEHSRDMFGETCREVVSVYARFDQESSAIDLSLVWYSDEKPVLTLHTPKYGQLARDVLQALLNRTMLRSADIELGGFFETQVNEAAICSKTYDYRSPLAECDSEDEE